MPAGLGQIMFLVMVNVILLIRSVYEPSKPDPDCRTAGFPDCD